MPSYTLHWEDRIEPGTSCTYLVLRQASTTLTTVTPAGTSWTARSLALPGNFNPVNDRLSMLMDSGSGRFYIRRFRVEDDDGSIYYGAWPTESSITYTADQQDGVGGEDYVGYDSGTGGGDNAVQYDLTLADFRAAGTGLDWYFAPIVGGWTVGVVRIS